MSIYSDEFQEQMVAKLLNPTGPSVLELSEESGISKSTLYKWLNTFKTRSLKQGKDMPQIRKLKPENWSAEAKLEAITVTLAMTEEEVGAYCREKGLYSRHLS